MNRQELRESILAHMKVFAQMTDKEFGIPYGMRTWRLASRTGETVRRCRDELIRMEAEGLVFREVIVEPNNIIWHRSKQ